MSPSLYLASHGRSAQKSGLDDTGSMSFWKWWIQHILLTDSAYVVNLFIFWPFNVAKQSTQLSRFKFIKINSLALKTTQLIFPPNYALSYYPRGAQSIQKSNGNLEILSATRMTWSKFHTQDPQNVGATSQIWSPRQPGARDLCNPALISKLKLRRLFCSNHDFLPF